MRLGIPSDEQPEGGVLADTTPLEGRPSVVSEGVELEVVWFPHKNAPSLLGDEVSRPSTLAVGPFPDHAGRSEHERPLELEGVGV